VVCVSFPSSLDHFDLFISSSLPINSLTYNNKCIKICFRQSFVRESRSRAYVFVSGVGVRCIRSGVFSIVQVDLIIVALYTRHRRDLGLVFIKTL
jgi:hypothetical protein